LLTTMSSSLPAAATSFAQSLPLVTSAWTKRAPISRATFSPFGSTSLTMTRAPSSAKRLAMPAPNPEPAPVTIATLSWSLTAGVSGFLERAMFAQFVDVARDAGALALEKILHRARELRVREPVRRGRFDRQQPAPQLVLALRAALEHGKPLADRLLDRLVEAALEVKQRHVLDRAPVASVERGLVLDEERSRDRAAVALRDEQRQVLRQRGPEAQEEVQAEIGARAVLGVSAAVAAVEEFPVAPLDAGAFEPPANNPGFLHPPALLADFLAPLARPAGEEGIEIGVARVAPVELHGAPQQHAVLEHQGDFFFARKQNMERGAVARELERRLQQDLLGRTEEARAAHRGERHRAQELRVVLDAVPLVRIGPRPVEHVLAVGMRLGEKRHRAHQRPGAAHQQEARRPAGARRGAAGIDQRGQELV